MTDSYDCQRAQEVFELAVARPPQERAALLAEACGDDEELRAEVESLLEHDKQASDDFMRPPEPPPSFRLMEPPEGPDPLIGETVGRYQIKSLIASGGMGAVYEAVQEQPQRTVALKVMKRHVASRSALRRFQLESHVLGNLRHPNVAQVYEAGMHDDGKVQVPYFAMEYIPDAKTIIEYAEERELGTRDRLRLFAKVCDAVYHGHQKGIIHRDLKPANILVDPTGEPKVIDFGVARATDSDIAITTIQTDAGQLIGTLQYMSPEQCAADASDLDTRSDVYSLGLVLYELLCGQLPYDVTRSSILAAARVICEEAPVRPSGVNRTLRGDLEMIVLKALQKDREERYQSAADLARDIRHYLNREPIEAHPPTAWTRTLHWVARHPVLATNAVSLTIAGLIIAGTLMSIWAFNRRPHRVWLSDDQREARLLSFIGGVLQTWTIEPPGKFIFAHLIERPTQLGGGKLALLGMCQSTDVRFPTGLCVVDTNGDLDDPIWTGRIKTKDILPELAERGSVAEHFSAHDCWTFDVFPEEPGPKVPEIVVSYTNGRHSQRVLRIYDLSGNCLYQVWHDGTIPLCYWMSDPRLLVFAGDYHRPYWDGGKLKGDQVKALVVFALHPERGQLGDNYLPTEPSNDPLSPVWYLRLEPVETADIANWSPLCEPDPPHEAGSHVTITVQLDGRDRNTVWWVIDKDGWEMEETRDWTDTYKRNQNLPDGHPDKLPDPNTFELVPWSLAE
ncbi:MAG: serine/threonine protein kinase [Phycisphaerae bacterium]|nr:serine/threonine protein kinase [Phycisphaerae bacterium]